MWDDFREIVVIIIVILMKIMGFEKKEGWKIYVLFIRIEGNKWGVEGIVDEWIFIYWMRRWCRATFGKVWELILLYWWGWDIYEMNNIY